MPKGNKKSKKRNTKYTQPPATSSSKQDYVKSTLSTFNSLYQSYIALKQGATLDCQREVQQLNAAHLTDPGANDVPALCIFLSQKSLTGTHLAFLNFLRKSGLEVRINLQTDIVLIERALLTRNILLLDWLVNDCEILIPNSSTLLSSGNVTFNIARTEILEYIEQNLGTDEADYFMDAFAKYHVAENSVLHLAAIHNKPELFHALVARGGNINQPNKHGITPAMYAAAYPDSDVAALICRYPIGLALDVKLLTTDGLSIFHHAVIGKSVSIFGFAVKKLEEQRGSFAELTEREGYNLVHWAIQQRQCSLLFEIFPLIDINAPGPDGNHLMVYAFINNEPEMGMHIATAARLDLETDRFNGNKSIFQLVIEYDALTSCSWLLDEEYFDISSVSDQGLPPLLLASKNGSICIIDDLLETYHLRDLNIDAVDEQGKRFSHHLAEQGIFEVLEMLIECQALDLDCTDKQGNTVLDVALLNNNNRTVKLCLLHIEKDYSLKKRRLKIRLSEIKQLENLLHIYCADSIGERVAQIDGVPPFHLACLKFDIDYVSELVGQYSVDINQVNTQGETTLCVLVKNASLEKVIQYITAFHPKLTELDENDSNLLQIACEINNDKLVDWCLKNQTLSITKPRKGDKFSALDIIIIKRNAKILHMLWGALSEVQRNIYLQVLIRKKEEFLLEFLRIEGIYQPAVTTVETAVLETAKEDIPLIPATVVKCSQKSTTNSEILDHFEKPEAGVIVCTEETLFDAVETRCDAEYFRKLKHHPEHAQTIAKFATPLLNAAIRSQNYRLVYHVLRVPVIAEKAHLHNNEALALACKYGSISIIELLLNQAQVAANVDSERSPAFLAATHSKHPEISKLLQQYIDINTKRNSIQDIDNDDSVSTVLDTTSPSCIGFSLETAGKSCGRISAFSNISGRTDLETPASFTDELPQFTDTPSTLTTLKPKDTRVEELDNIDVLAANYTNLRVSAKTFELLPRCFLNSKYLYDSLHALRQNFILAKLNGFIYGSVHYKLNPGDIDILLPATSIEFDFAAIYNLIDIFLSQGGEITCENSGPYKYGYQQDGRHIIPVLWHGINIDIVVYPKTIMQHATDLDFTNSARYLSVIDFTCATTPGIYSSIDIVRKRIQTVTDAHVSFLKDPRRIFRAVKQMVDEGLCLSQHCQQAIQDIFGGANNPFISNISIGKIFFRMEVMLKSGRIYDHFAILNRLGIFDKLYAVFISRNDYTSNYYRNIMQPYKNMLIRQAEFEVMQQVGLNPHALYSHPQQKVATTDMVCSFLNQGF